MNIISNLSSRMFKKLSLVVMVLVLVLSISIIAKAEKTSPPTKPLPFCISSTVVKTGDVSICMDGATHILNSPIVETRVKPLNEHVEKTLAEFASSGKTATVCGYQRESPECPPLIIGVYVKSADDFDALLKQDFKQ